MLYVIINLYLPYKEKQSIPRSNHPALHYIF